MGKASSRTTQKPSSGFDWRQRKGNAEAQSDLGVMYDKGQGVAQDYAEAVKWYRLAAAQGMRWRNSDLGLMYDHGQGVKQDYAEAVKWYRLAAAQGDARRKSVSADVSAGKASSRTSRRSQVVSTAAAQGIARGAIDLGTMYFNGQGVAQNYALRWYRLAAAQRNAKAELALALCITMGEVSRRTTRKRLGGFV